MRSPDTAACAGLRVQSLALPFPALGYAFAIVALFLVIGEFIQNPAGKILAFAAVFVFFAFTARFYRTTIPPERLLDIRTARATHLFFVTAFTAKYSTS